MAVQTTNNKPINPRGNDQSPKGYNRAALYSGKALDFDGVNDKVITSFALTNDEVSVSFYLNWDDVGTQTIGFICEGSANDKMMIHTGASGAGVNGLQIAINVTNYSVPQIISEGWNHYLITSDRTNLNIYKNGVLFDSRTTDAGAIDITALTLGVRPIGSAYALDGKLSNFKVYSTALTAAQVADLYNNPEKIVPTGVEDTALKLWLPMMEGAGTTAYDGSGNGNHGTISGATYVNGVGSPVAQSAVIDWNKGTNLLKLSEQLNESTHWARTYADVTEDDETAPDGQSTAELIKDTTTTAPHYVNGSVTTAASTTYVQSVWVKKKDDGIYAGIRTNGVGGDSYIIFDFDTATIVANGSDIISKGVETYSNGWYRIYMTYTLAPTGAIYSVTNSSSNVIASYAGTGKGYYIWGAQLEASDSLTAYIPNHTNAAITSDVLLPQGLTTGRDITGVNLFENVRKQGALNLDGNSWAEVHDNASLDITDAVSVEMWIYWEDQSAESTILGKWLSGADRAYALIATTTTGEIDFRQRVSSSTYSLGISTLSSGWNHVVATHDHSANERIGYINGVQVSISSSQGVSNASDNDVTIGGSSTAQYTNSIAQPRIYNRALTAEEVQRNYDAGKNIYS